METIHFKSTTLNLVFEEGYLRYICIHQFEILRMIYFAVRDANWNTIPHQIENIRQEVLPDGFLIQYECWCQNGHDIDFRWNCEINIQKDILEFSISGKAHSNFQRNRIGFCILHPLECAGKEVLVTHSDQSQKKYLFPKFINPHQPFKDIKAIQWEVNEIKAQLEFEGDIFEMEDQRNWLDASYKTYCTPLELPFPVEVKIGDEVNQKVTLHIKSRYFNQLHSQTENYKVDFDKVRMALPEIGLETNEENLDDISIKRLMDLQLSHLRVEAELNKENWQESFDKRLKQATQLFCPIELVIFLHSEVLNQIQFLREKINKEHHIRYILLIDAQSKSSSKSFLEETLPLVRNIFPEISIGGGTDFYFTEINRFRPPVDLLDFISFSINPQVHAFDDQSIIETIQTQGVLVPSARAHFGDIPIHISPITFKPRKNPDATIEISEETIKNMRIDKRQHQLLTALWTLGGFKQLAQSGVSRLTYFQTVGEEGLMMPNRPSKFDFFQVDAGSVFPVYELFKIFGQYHGGHIIRCKSSHPMLFEAMLLQKGSQQTLLLASFCEKTIEISVKGKLYLLDPKSIKVIPTFE